MTITRTKGGKSAKREDNTEAFDFDYLCGVQSTPNERNGAETTEKDEGKEVAKR